MSATLKPFYVTFSYSAVVMAADAIGAMHQAESYADMIVRDCGGPTAEQEVELKSIEHLQRIAYGEWDANCCAYGPGNPRLGDILPEADPPERDTRTIDMFEAGS